MRTLAAQLESSQLRASGKTAEAYKVLEDHISGAALRCANEEKPLINEYANAVQGSLVIDFVENLIRDGELARARLELQEWRPLHPQAPSTMEKTISRRCDLILGRILKDQGNFSEAVSYLENIYNAFSPEDHLISSGWQMLLISVLSDLYCETGRAKDSEMILKDQLDIFYARRWSNTSTGNTLKIALTESFIRRGMFTKAEELLSDLSSTYAKIPDPGLLANTNHFRVWAGLARVSHLQNQWGAALTRWETALKLVEESGWTKGFNHGIVLYSIAQILARTEGVNKSREMFEKARKSLEVEERKYWSPGLGSYWYDYVVTTPGEAGPNPIIAQSEKAASDISDPSVDSNLPPGLSKETDDILPN